jgi:hypothetical protein
MKRNRPLKPFRNAEWNPRLKRWEAGKGARIPKIRARKRSKLADDRLYATRRRWFLAMPENSSCPVAWAGLIPDLNGYLRPHWRAAVEIHHTRGRIGRMLLAEEFWLGVSSEGHRWIHDHPALARESGLLCDTVGTKERQDRMMGKTKALWDARENNC